MSILVTLASPIPPVPGAETGTPGPGGITDVDGDGWDDSWLARHPGIDLSNPLADFNGDGLPLYLEMLMGLDPPADRTGAAGGGDDAKAALRARIAAMESARAATLPYLNPGVRGTDGRPTTRAGRRAQQAEEFARFVTRQRVESEKARRRVRAFLESDAARQLPAALTRDNPPYDVVGGQPRWHGALALPQAANGGISRLWPGYTEFEVPDFDLTGAGTRVFMWDVGIPNPTHQQFVQSQVDPRDFVGVSDHATAVANVLGGRGNPNVNDPGNLGDPYAIPLPEAARGMSYEAEIVAFDLDDDLEETSNVLLDPEEDMYLSNHSYGTACGWQQAGPSAQWFWHGYAYGTDPDVSEPLEKEDWKFGAYTLESQTIDRLHYDNPAYLGVWAAGNDLLNVNVLGEPVAAPEPNDRGPDFIGEQPVNHIVPGFGNFTTVRRPEDGANPPEYSWDTLRPEACAKNILTVGAGINRYPVAFAPFSSGPTDDGRVKVDVLADAGGEFSQPGFGSSGAYSGASNVYGGIDGTSFAAPLVTGGLALVRQLWDQRRGSSPEVAPWGSTLKALAIAGAIPADTLNYGPSYQHGWGSFDALASAGIVHLDSEPEVAAEYPLIKQVELRPEIGSSIEFRLDRRFEHTFDFYWRFIGLPTNFIRNGGAVIATIVWTDPQAREIQTDEDPVKALESLDDRTPRLVNDLDLELVYDEGGPDEAAYYP